MKRRSAVPYAALAHPLAGVFPCRREISSGSHLPAAHASPAVAGGTVLYLRQRSAGPAAVAGTTQRRPAVPAGTQRKTSIKTASAVQIRRAPAGRVCPGRPDMAARRSVSRGCDPAAARSVGDSGATR